MNTRLVIKVMVALLAMGLTPSLAGAQATEASLIKEGDALYNKAYGDKKTKESITKYQAAFKLNPKSFEARWRLARSYFWITDNTKNKTRDKDMGWLGYTHALQALRLKPKRVEGHYWAALCMGEYSKGLGILTALKKGIEGKFKRHLSKAMSIKRCYDHGGGDRAFGNLFFLLPWPKKDRKKALKHYSWSLRCRKDVPRTYYYIGRAQSDDGNKAEAITALEKCLTVRRGKATDNYRAKRWCKKLLATLKK